jgi:glycosyltransferase involved in cell wall biosynthesis
VSAALLVKDEEDIIEYTVRHLLEQVDRVVVCDNMSTDRTREILVEIGSEPRGDRGELHIWDDEEPGYYQADKMTDLGRRAWEDGYRWFLPCDADEYWYSPFGRIADVLASLDEVEPQAQFAAALMKNHLVTGTDPRPSDEPNPFRRLGWRLEEMNRLPKIAVRTSAFLRMEMGNHGASTAGVVHSARSATIDGQLYIHHFPWRSEEQFLRKITNGSRAYAHTNMPETVGAHWRSFGPPESFQFEQRVRDWFTRYGYRHDPRAPHEEPLIYDPAVA